MEELLRRLEKQFGKDEVLRVGDIKPIKGNVIPTGNIMFDKALGCMGWPKGRISVLWGAEQSGKTTICLTAIRECQKQGGNCAFLDMEHSISLDYAKAIGVDVDNIILAQPSHGEKCLDIAIALAESGEIDLIVIDSIAALTPLAEITKGMDESTIGEQARMLGKFCRKITSIASEHNVAILMTNQIRSKVGVVYGSPDTMPGGRAVKFFSSAIVRVGKLKTEEDCNITKIKVEKNKMDIPYKEAEMEIIFGKGLSDGIIDAAIEVGIIAKSGSWFSYNDYKVQGKDNLEEYINSNPEFKKEIEQKLKGITC